VIASLAMYDAGPLQAANDALWGLIRDRLLARGLSAPVALTRGEAAYWPTWTSPGLVLSQTCGFPFRARLYGQVTLVGTPDYGIEGCAPGYYRSVLVARADDPRDGLAAFDGARLAYNEALSQSGWAAPVVEAARRGIRFRVGPATGSHAASAHAVATGQADIAALDAVTWEMLTAHGLAPDGLRVIDRTAPTPALPYIAAKGADAGATFDTLAEAVDALPPVHRDRLRLKGVLHIPAEAYLAVPTPPSPAHFG
jgi:hypothetical protein